MNCKSTTGFAAGTAGACDGLCPDADADCEVAGGVVGCGGTTIDGEIAGGCGETASGCIGVRIVGCGNTDGASAGCGVAALAAGGGFVVQVI